MPFLTKLNLLKENCCFYFSGLQDGWSFDLLHQFNADYNESYEAQKIEAANKIHWSL